MIDAFLSTCGNEPLRLGLATATFAYFSLREDINLTVIRNKDAWLAPADRPCLSLGLDRENFQRERRKQADICATTSIYLMLDDDVLPMQESFIEQGLEIMERHPKFAVIGLRERGVQYLTENGETDDEVEERSEAGGIYFIRRGLITNWPRIMADNNYDFLQAEAARIAGWKVGIFRNLTFNHLGLNFSTATYNTTGYVVN